MRAQQPEFLFMTADEYFDNLKVPPGWTSNTGLYNVRMWTNEDGTKSVTAIISRARDGYDWLCLMLENKQSTPTIADVTFAIEHWGWKGRRWVMEFSPGWHEALPPKVIQLNCTIGEDILRRLG